MAQTAWHDRLKEEVEKGEIPNYLVDLQTLVSGLRRYRDNLKIPAADDVLPLLSERIRRHASLTLAYLDDARYRAVVDEALQQTG